MRVLLILAVTVTSWVLTAASECNGDYSCQSSNKCISWYWVCDGVRDCPFGDDEDYCDETTITTETSDCPGNEYSCRNSDKCISRYWVCDGMADCPYGDDEDDCYEPSTTEKWHCSPGYYHCENTFDCIPSSYICNNNYDCPNGDDEDKCYFTTPEMTTHHHQVDCKEPFEFIYDRCVFVDPFTETPWDEARYFCQKFSSDLVVIEEGMFFTKLLNYLTDKGLDSTDYWVGASNRTEEKQWRWVDFTPVHMGAPLWALYGCNSDLELEPRQDRSYQCAYLDGSRGLYMAAADCNEEYGAICQK